MPLARNFTRYATCLTLIAALNALEPAIAQDDEFLNEDWIGKLGKTDFTKSDIRLELLLAPEPIDEVVASIDNPKFTEPLELDAGISPQEPVIVVTRNQQTRAYPVRYLLWAHVINDTIGGEPVLVSFSPYTDSFAVFSRIVNAQTMTFEYTGLLYQASPVLQDNQTGSLFLQVHGKGAVGALHKQDLRILPAQYLSVEKFLALYGHNPNAKIMTEPPVFHDGVLYGRTPFVGYDSEVRSFFYQGTPVPTSDRLSHFERIISYDKRSLGWSLRYIKNRGTVEIPSERVRIRWEEGMTSVQDTFDLQAARNIGMVHVEKQSESGEWQPILFHRDFAFTFLSFFPGRRILHN